MNSFNPPSFGVSLVALCIHCAGVRPTLLTNPTLLTGPGPANLAQLTNPTKPPNNYHLPQSKLSVRSTGIRI